MIEKASPEYIEAKAYMYVGFSRLRLNIENMPSFSEIMSFAQQLEAMTNYKIKDSSEDSRVVLLVKE